MHDTPPQFKPEDETDTPVDINGQPLETWAPKMNRGGVIIAWLVLGLMALALVAGLAMVFAG